MYHGCGDVDHCGEAGVGFVGPHGDAFELLELAEEVFDQVTPFVHLGVDRERLQATRMLRDHDLGAAGVEIGDVAASRMRASLRKTDNVQNLSHFGLG